MAMVTAVEKSIQGFRRCDALRLEDGGERGEYSTMAGRRESASQAEWWAKEDFEGDDQKSNLRTGRMRESERRGIAKRARSG
jgi:hypothetical protein